MTPDQQLLLFEPPAMPVDPDAITLLKYLDRAFTWRTRAQIMQDLNFDDRRIRAARKASNFQIVAGQKGFRHIRHCTSDERSAAHAQFESQGKDMLAEAKGYRQAAAVWNIFEQHNSKPRSLSNA